MSNEYGLDVKYFQKWIKRALMDISRYTPSELARELLRMSRTANSDVIHEPEFDQWVPKPEPLKGEWWMCLSNDTNRCAPMVKVPQGWASIMMKDGTPIDTFISPDNCLIPMFRMVKAETGNVNYEKGQGHHCWWLKRNGIEIANFDNELHVDEIVSMNTAYHDTVNT